MKKSIKDSIDELKYIIQGLESYSRAIRSELADPERVERSIKDHEAKIAWHQKSIDAYRERQANGPGIIAENTRKASRLRKKVKLLEQSEAIAKLVALQESINELNRDVNTCEVNLYYGADKYLLCGQPVTTTIRHGGKLVACCQECSDLHAANGPVPFNYRGEARRLHNVGAK